MTLSTRTHIRFRLNDRTVTLNTLRPTETLLDFLRLERRLTGTKEGCAEGDCGACTVLVGRLNRDGVLVYETVTSCIRFVASLDGCHVVTIEHLKGKDGTLHPVQQAMVDHHGSQCGFCTPGIVMALYALWMRDAHPSRPTIEKALQGNLCRCTGYEPIIRAAEAMAEISQKTADPLQAERDEVRSQLAEWQTGETVDMGDGADRLILPASIDALAQSFAANPKATIVAGSTDVGLWVTKQMRPIGPLIFVKQVEGLDAIEETDGGIRIGATVSYTDASAVLSETYPAMRAYFDRIGGDQVRNMGTIGGNIANGSPIGDTPPPLIALGATVTLNNAGTHRTVPLEEFFIDYGNQDRQPGEFVERIDIPKLRNNEIFAVYKISKRRDEDISALAGAFKLMIEAGRITDARIAFGGMAATPKRARHVEAALVGRDWSIETIEAALPAFESDYQPLSDWRASSDYRMMTAKNLLRRCFLEQQGETASLKRFAAVEA
ncbi:xanthine dehydrogenase small subunit [Rhizobium albus]|nr:xanthine dehydrogenase small subunit [Rhizobium albus]